MKWQQIYITEVWAKAEGIRKLDSESFWEGENGEGIT